MAKHLLHLAWLASLVASSSTALVGCGGDDDGGKPEPDSGMPDASTAGTGGMGGGGGSGGAGGSVAVAAPVKCGTALCQQPTNPLTALLGLAGGLAGGGMTPALPMAMACCLDEAAGTCGLTAMAGGTCEAPAVVDDRCPRLEFPAPAGLPFDIGALLGPNVGAGCCTESGDCGLDGSLFGRGCVELSQAATMLGGAGMMDAGTAAPGGGLGGLGGMLMFPEPQRCDAVTSGDDGGTDSDGGN